MGNPSLTESDVPKHGWRCPLCLSGFYTRVVVGKPGGGEYRTEFSECSRCSVMFRRPERFMRLGIPPDELARDTGPKTIEEAQAYWRLKMEKKL